MVGKEMCTVTTELQNKQRADLNTYSEPSPLTFFV